MIVVSSDGVKNTVKFINSASSKTLPLLTKQLKSALSLYSTSRTNPSFSQLDKAFIEFTDFCYLQNQQSHKLIYKELNDFDGFFFKSFYDYLINLDDVNTATRRFKPFKKALADYQKQNSDTVSPLIFPSIRKTKHNNNQPLPLSTVNQLRNALKLEIDKIYQRLDFIKSIDSSGKELHWEELSQQLLSDDFSLKNLCHRYKYHYKEEKKAKLIINFKKNLLECPDKIISNMHVSEFIKNYHENDWNKLAEQGRMPRSEGMTAIQFKLVDVLATLKKQYPNYPLNTELNTLVTHMSGFQSDHKKGTFNGSIIGELDNIFDAFRYKVGGACRGRVNAKPTFVDSDINMWEDVLYQLYPSRSELVAILLLVMLQTGWNKETVMNVELNDFTHPLSSIANSGNILITSSKARGQQTDKPYFESKMMYAISSISDKYSAYNLLGLLKTITQSLRGTYHYENTEKNGYFSDAFICLKSESQWKSTEGLITSIASKNVYSKSVKAFLKQYEIYENGSRYTKSSDFSERLRPTWQIYKKKLGVSSKVISLLMGHEQSETTDVHYDSSPLAAFDRIQRLGKELNVIESELKSGAFKGTLIPIRVENNSKPEFRVGHIFADESHDTERLICLCSDSSKPTFKNHELYVREGQNCKFITKCLLCKQSTVTRNSLPYIIDRLSYINGQQGFTPPLSFEALYGDEKAAIEYVLDNWPSEDDIFEAEVFQMENYPLLPAMPNLSWGE